MKLGLVYARAAGEAFRRLDAEVLRELRPDCLYLPVYSVEELVERARELGHLKQTAVISVPVERWSAREVAEAVAMVKASTWIAGVELGHAPRSVDFSTFVARAANMARQLHDATGQRIAVLNLGAPTLDADAGRFVDDLAEALVEASRWRTLDGRLATAYSDAATLVAELSGVRVSMVGGGWPSATETERLAERLAFLFRAPLYVEIGYSAGAVLTPLERARAYALGLVVRRPLAWRWSSRPAFLEGWLRDLWLRAAWLHWRGVGASAVFVSRFREPRGSFDESSVLALTGTKGTPNGYVQAFRASDAWRALRLASTPGDVGDKWTASI